MVLKIATLDLNAPHIRVLGTMSIHQPGMAVDKVTGGAATGLAALIATRERGISLQEIADLCWPDDLPPHWQGLMSFYRRMLQQRLPRGWTISGESVLALSIDDGWIDAWSLCDVDALSWSASDAALLRGMPYVGVNRQGLIGDSAKALELRQELLRQPLPSPVPIVDEQHHAQMSPLPDLLDAEQHVLVTTSTHTAETTAALRLHLERQASSRDYLVPGGVPFSIRFGDIAAALPRVRSTLLDIQNDSEKAQVAEAWRVVREHVATQTPPGHGRIVVFNADHIDDWSLRLLRQVVRFPLHADTRVVIIGDPDNPRVVWQELLHSVQAAGYAHVAMCDTCAPETMSGSLIGTWTGTSTG